MSFYLFLQQQHFKLMFCYCLGQGFKSLMCKTGLLISLFLLDFIYVEEFQLHAVVAAKETKGTLTRDSAYLPRLDYDSANEITVACAKQKFNNCLVYWVSSAIRESLSQSFLLPFSISSYVSHIYIY